jgi:hypothetical protein
MDIGNFEVIAILGDAAPIKSKKVVCISDYENNWGGCGVIKDHLKVGETYEVEKTEVHSWHTKIWLKGFDEPFNSVHFEEVEC